MSQLPGDRDDGPDRPDRATTLRYSALQIPGLALACVFAMAAIQWFDVPTWAAGLSVLLWIAKDVVMFPFVWRAYTSRDGGGLHGVRGRIGVVEEALAPHGRIRLGSESWRARAKPGRAEIPEGATVRVVAVDGLRLTVEPTDADAPAGALDGP